MSRITTLALVVAIHLALVAALLSYTPVRKALGLNQVLMIDFIRPPQPPVPEPQEIPKPKEMKVVKRAPEPVKPLPLLALASDAPTPAVIALQPEPSKAAPPVEAVPLPAPPAPRVAPPAAPMTITGVQYLRPPQPQYPALSKRRGEEGRVVLRVLVNSQGQPERAEVQTGSGSERLDDAARRAALLALFKPHIENGRPVTVWAIVPILFSLEG